MNPTDNNNDPNPAEHLFGYTVDDPFDASFHYSKSKSSMHVLRLVPAKENGHTGKTKQGLLPNSVKLKE